MRLGPGAFLRVGLLLIVTVLLQLSVVGQIGVLGSYADITPLAVAAVAYYGGSIAGSSAGFAAGFLLDLATGATMGASSLVLTAVGYGVGRFREVPVGAAATAGWVTAYAAVSFMLDVGATVSPLVIRDALVTVLIGALLALPMFVVSRKLLRPSLVVDPYQLRRRRRAPQEAGPIGLRGLEV
jgi:cell shape-determining protein MreD